MPEWTQGDRLRKARALTGMNAASFAAAIGVSEKTISNAEGDKRAVRRITINAWALATGVSVEWLMTGESAPSGGPSGPQGAPADRAARVEALAAQKRGRTTDRYIAPAPAYAGVAA